MEIIKEYGERLKHIRYNGDDSKLLKKRFPILKEDTVDDLCEWLKNNNSHIDSIDFYEPQSGWYGINFMIGKADLALNGHCLSDSSVRMFLNGEQDPMWYRIWEQECKDAENWVKLNKNK